MRSAVLPDTAYQPVALGVALANVPRLSNKIDTYALTGGTARTITVPTGTEEAYFSAETSTGSFLPFRAQDKAIGTAAYPTGDVTNGTSSTSNPTARNVRGVAELSIVSPAGQSGYINIEWLGSVTLVG